jgi:uncharacterized membrane-anchored protein
VKLATLRRGPGGGRLPEASGPARLDRRTKRLTKRLRPGDIAVIDHVDLDRIAAEALLACKVAGVVNVAPSISGRYPNLGPQVLVDAGVALLDAVGEAVFDELSDGTLVRIDGDTLYVGETPIVTGQAQDSETIAAAMAEARAGLSTQLEAFAANTMEYLRRERDLLIDGVGVPDVRTSFDDRHALIVVRGYHYRDDLRLLRSYIREYRPVLVGVDGGADALVEEGYKPDMIVGDMDSVSDQVLRSGAEVVVHAYPDGTAPGLKRVQELNLDAVTFPAAATSEDIAMLLADEKGASLIVAVGTHATLVEFLDKGRAGMASTFLTRLRIGSKLVDAKGVSRLYRQNISSKALMAMVVAAALAMSAAIYASLASQAYLDILRDQWNSFWFWLKDIIQ